MPGALHGVKIIDLTRVLAGPFCTMILGDLGAEVIKVESINNGDETRGWGPPFVEGESAYYLCANRNKQGITLNLKSEQGKEILKKLISEADVVVQNFKPGTLVKLGFAYDEMKKVKQDIILASISGFGSEGPDSSLPGYDYIIQAMSGLMSITGEKEAEPSKVGVAISDVLTGLFTCIGILASLQHRNRTGEGQEIDISLFDSQLAALVNVASNYLCSGIVPERMGNYHPNIVPYQVFSASDGELVVAVGNDEQFKRFALLIDEPALFDEIYKTNSGRLKHRKQIEQLIQRKLKTKTKNEWKVLLDQNGIPNGPINNVSEALQSKQAKSREMVIEVEHPFIKDLRLVGSPLKLSKTPIEVLRHPPLHGEHTVEIMNKLGYTKIEIEELKRNHTI